MAVIASQSKENQFRQKHINSTQLIAFPSFTVHLFKKEDMYTKRLSLDTFTPAVHRINDLFTYFSFPSSMLSFSSTNRSN